MLLPCKHAQYDLLIFFPCNTQQTVMFSEAAKCATCFSRRMNTQTQQRKKSLRCHYSCMQYCYAECKFFGVLVGKKTTHIQITTHVTLRSICSLCVGVVYKWLLTCDSIHLWFPHILLHKQTQHLKRFNMKTIVLQYGLLSI